MATEIKIRNVAWHSPQYVEADVADWIRQTFCRESDKEYDPGPPLKIIITVVEDEK